MPITHVYRKSNNKLGIFAYPFFHITRAQLCVTEWAVEDKLTVFLIL